MGLVLARFKEQKCGPEGQDRHGAAALAWLLIIFFWPVSGRQFQEDLVRRRTQESGGWSAWVQWKPLEDLVEGGHIEWSPGSLTCPGVLVNPDPALRCSGPTLTSKRAGVLCNRALCMVPVRWVLPRRGPCPGRGMPTWPHALGGVCE